MCYDDELGLGRQLPKQAGEALDVGVIKGGVDLVQEAEGRRPHKKHRKEQGQGRKGLLPGRKEGDGAQPLARRLDGDIHAGLEDVIVRQEELRRAALKEAGEDLPEAVVHRIEGLPHHAAAGPVDLLDGGLEVLDGAL